MEKKFKIILIVLFFLGIMCSPGVTAEIPILPGKVEVTATLVKEHDFEFSSKEFELMVKHGKEWFKLGTELVGVEDQQNAIETMKKTIGWKDGYLFVRQERGGGNAWRCSTDRVFALRKGHLIYIGEVLGQRPIYNIAEIARESKKAGPGSFYKNGYFMDYYDKFEYNDLTSHAGAPMIPIFKKERGGEFHVDLQRTWQENQKEFKENERAIGQEVELDSLFLESKLLFNAVLAKYCGLPKELKEMIKIAKAKLFQFKFQAFVKILGEVVPGEQPE